MAYYSVIKLPVILSRYCCYPICQSACLPAYQPICLSIPLSKHTTSPGDSDLNKIEFPFDGAPHSFAYLSDTFAINEIRKESTLWTTDTNR